MPAPSWDVAIIVFFLIGIAFGYILQREKIIATLLSAYAGLVISQVFSGDAVSFFEGSKTIGAFWVKSGASPFTIKAIIFILVIVLLSAKGGISGTKGKGLLSPIELFLLSFLTTALVLTSIFHFMPGANQDALMNSSRMAVIIIKYYQWWILLPVVALVGIGFIHKRSSSSE